MTPFQFDLVPDGAEYHRCFYRGEDLTYAFESGEFSASVANGSFRGIFPGDYIMRKIRIADYSYTVRFIIADLDFATSHRYAAHHAVIIPETPVFETYMNPPDIRSGGYADSCMNRTLMPAFAQGLSEAFGASHFLRFNADGQSYLCRLMTLSMVFGRTLPGEYAGYSNAGYSYSDYQKVDQCMGEEQLAAFRNNPDLRGKDMYYWLSDVKDPSGFAIVFSGEYGVVYAYADSASYGSRGVRPFALLM